MRVPRGAPWYNSIHSEDGVSRKTLRPVFQETPNDRDSSLGEIEVSDEFGGSSNLKLWRSQKAAATTLLPISVQIFSVA